MVHFPCDMQFNMLQCTQLKRSNTLDASSRASLFFRNTLHYNSIHTFRRFNTLTLLQCPRKIFLPKSIRRKYT